MRVLQALCWLVICVAVWFAMNQAAQPFTADHMFCGVLSLIVAVVFYDRLQRRPPR